MNDNKPTWISPETVNVASETSHQPDDLSQELSG